MLLYERGIEAIVAAYIINDKNEVLLFQSPKWDNEWSICGGHINLGETIENATKREIKEQTGLDILLIDTLAVGNFFAHPPMFSRHAHFISIDSVVRVAGGDIKLEQAEISNAAWFSIDSALMLPKIAPSCYKGLQKLKKWMEQHTS